MRLKIKYYWTFIFLCVTFSTKAQSLVQLDSLIANKEFENAKVSVERIIFSQTLTPVQLAKVLLKKSECLKQQEQFAEAQKTLERIILFDLPDSLQYAVRHQTALCAYLSRDYSGCESILEQLEYFTKDSLLKQQSLPLEILNLNELNRWADAKIKWERYLRSKNISANSFVNAYAKYPHLKNLKKAQWLAFIPGAGLIYAGKTTEGLTAATLQMLSLGAGVYLFLQHYYITGFFVGPGIWSTFYQGSLRLTERRVNEVNRKKSVLFNATIVHKIFEIEKMK